MAARQVFLDTETTSLQPDRLAWEVGMIRRDEDGTEDEIRMFVHEVDISHAEAKALDVGRYYERHPRANGLADAIEAGAAGLEVVARAVEATLDTLEERLEVDFKRQKIRADPTLIGLYDEREVARIVERWTRGAVIIGANPGFDTEVLGNMLRRHKLRPSWDYRLVDVESIALHLFGLGDGGRPRGIGKVAELLKIEFDPAEAHTALGDARLVQKIFDQLVPSRVVDAQVVDEPVEPSPFVGPWDRIDDVPTVIPVVEWRHEGRSCPVCKANLTGSTGLTTSDAPDPGSFCLCGQCASILVVGDDHALREPDRAEWAVIHIDPQVAQARAAVRDLVARRASDR